MRDESRFRWTAGVIALAALGACTSGNGRADTTPSLDARTSVALPAEAQQAVLREMRQMLGAMGGAMAAAAAGDTAALIAALAPAGSAAAADPAIEALLPTAWKELADQTHGGFDGLMGSVRLARDGKALKDTVLVQLARLSGSCTACHETFRVTVSDGPVPSRE